MGDLQDQSSPLSTAPREHMITAAVRFLGNPKVAGSSDEQKIIFLKQKGLNDEEINEAFLRSASVAYSVEQTQTCAFLSTRQSSRFIGPLQAVCHVIVVFFGGGYIIYYIVKTYVLPWLTGGRRPRSGEQRLAALQSSLDESVRSLAASLQVIQSQVAEQQRTLLQLGRPADDTAQLRRELTQLRTEITSVKGLLLNRQQFPAAPSPPAPSIPAWQMVKTPPPEAVDKGKADSSSSGEIVIVSGNNSDNSDQHSDS
ncbi:peroxisomal membrane protein PEX14-like isoform X2 [Pollicipes pollicipes]|nr:peroxisomal membrane protein PEX14-like isoform X2 [Pollicipes pollicipes]XP_037075577.1 peroxisomal membrane protein PEX14-like isoform X2 [Pollicipes pollicipes]XP_037075579.1 peroxisomal membrane protein PEX14-like isoform X2 [Pollicipes pollicipes]XP_037075580.1 peroxisomal membrane protein PEX14-like isoform X2 [Pollicipes pollicipes]XP_037075581.1 peroxisomal membrane protein PEX14-like isoform X2 [Pollicipes pollicipes]